ncbi:hypothetical protein ACF91D_28210 [Staphylococcus sp. 231237_7MaSpsaltlick]|jgi:hypothetical protein|uniref:hypothetical protein n=1 Tax=Staphylococcus sp. 231237_7MaSpsaltlick TaxID=3367518 RepID=UPI00370B64AA
MKLNFKKKSIVLIASAVLFAPIASDLSNPTNNNNNVIHAATKTKYKLASVKSKNVSVKQQKKKDKDKAIADGILALGVGEIPGLVGKTGSVLLGVAGVKGAINQIDKKYVPITVKKYHYVPVKKTKNTGKIMSGYNEGYYIYKIFNQKTKKQIGKGKKIYIQRA